jgi:hypothetical protein
LFFHCSDCFYFLILAIFRNGFGVLPKPASNIEQQKEVQRTSPTILPSVKSGIPQMAKSHLWNQAFEKF